MRIHTICRSTAIAVGIVGAIALAIGMSAERGRPHRPPPPPALAVGGSMVIDIGTGAAALSSLPVDERREQWRDWALYGALPRLGANANEAKVGTYKMPPVRFPYLRDLYVFDYGFGRRIYLGSRVAMFYDDAAPDSQAVIGRLADQVRMETGKKSGAELYAFHVDQEHGTIAVTRKPDVPVSDLFGAAYGYTEANVSTLEDFTGLLGKIDDVTYSANQSGVMVFGGRRFEHSRTLGVTVEDVAALYQANAGVAAAAKTVQTKLDAIDADVNRAYKNAQETGDDSPRLHEKYQKELESRSEQVVRDAEVPSSPGFSLDPQFVRTVRDGHVAWNIATDLEKLAADPCGTLRAFGAEAHAIVASATSDESARVAREWAAITLDNLANSEGPRLCARVSSAMREQIRDAAREIAESPEHGWQSHFVSYYNLKSELHTSADEDDTAQVVDALVLYIEHRDEVQCARYDGPSPGQRGALQGTRVGMNLFYTDLLAKLWAGLDFHRSAPLEVLPGMLTGPRTRRPKTFAAEDKERPNTRLWFGPRADAVTRSGDGDLAFRHVATRVYAAGSDPREPGKEAQPADWAGRVLSWWDRHYAEVAAYEPQYELQNQIMKWSVISAQMVRDHADFLQDVQVNRSNRFDSWLVASRSQLHYQYPVTLRPESPTGTECLDLLSSAWFSDRENGRVLQLSGGVTLGGERSLDALAHVGEDGELGMRFHPAQDIGAGDAGTASRTWPELDGTDSIAQVVTDKHVSLTRAGATDMQLGKTVSLRVEANGEGGLSASIASERGNIGRLDVEVDGDRAALSWSADDAEVAHALAERAATYSPTMAPEMIAPAGGSPIVLQDEGALVIPGENGGALRIAQHASDDPFVARAGDIAVSQSDDAAFAKQADAYEWQRLSVDAENQGFDTSASVVRTFTHESPASSARHVSLGGITADGKSVDVLVDDAGIWVPKPADEAGRVAWRSLDRSIDLRPSVVESVASGKITSVPRASEVPHVAAAISGGDYRAALMALPPETLGDTAALARSLDRTADELGARMNRDLAYANIGDAAPLHQIANDFLKRNPDSVLGDVLFDLGLERPQSALDKVKRIVADRVGSPEELKQFQLSIERAGAPDVADYVLSTRGLGTIDADVLGSLEPIVSSDGRLGLRYRVASPMKTEVVPRDIRGFVAESGDVVYVDDRLRLNREGAETELDPQIGDWATDAHQVWESTPPIGTYPMVIENDGVTYSRINATARGSVPTGGGRILLIRPCDPSTDRDCHK